MGFYFTTEVSAVTSESGAGGGLQAAATASNGGVVPRLNDKSRASMGRAVILMTIMCHRRWEW